VKAKDVSAIHIISVNQIAFFKIRSVRSGRKKLEEKLSVIGGEKKPMLLERGHFGKGDRAEAAKRRK